MRNSILVQRCKSQSLTEDCSRTYRTTRAEISTVDSVRGESRFELYLISQCVLYHFKCDLYDADYVGYTCRHLYQRIDEHMGSVIWNHVRDEHGRDPSDVSRSFKILRKCQSKFDCLIYEMLFIKELKPTLNMQSDSIRANLFL